MKQRLVIIWLLFLATLSFSQAWESVRAPIYDRGLADRMQPFMPSDNPALLSGITAPFFSAQMDLSALSQIAFAYSLPVTAETGLGFVWAMERGTEAKLESLAQIELENRQQHLLLSSGSMLGKIAWGQQLYFRYRTKSMRFYASLNSQIKPDFPPEQEIEVQYRVGLMRPLSNSVDLAVLTPPLFAYSRLITERRTPISTGKFWEEPGVGSHAPLFSILWRPTPGLSLALSNRGRSDKSGWQIAFKKNIQNGIETIFGYRHRDVTGSERGSHWLGGLNIHYRGLDVLIGLAEKQTARLCVVFTPEHRKDLIDLISMRQLTHRIYPYSIKRITEVPLVEFRVANNENKLVFLDVVLKDGLKGHHKESYRLLPHESRQLLVKLPQSLLNSPPGHRSLSLNLSAWQKGSQTITHQMNVELMDQHDWSGESSDLLHFIEPFDESILRIAGKIADTCRTTQNQCLVRAAYAYLRQNMHYVMDPRPYGSRQDRVQYANETALLRKGDCEDITVLFASLLQALGLRTALIDILPPEEEGHIFILVEDPRSFNELLLADENLQRYILRRGNSGKTRAFLPLELTLLQDDFDTAWTRGLEQYDFYGREMQGLVEGWVKIIDIQ